VLTALRQESVAAECSQCVALPLFLFCTSQQKQRKFCANNANTLPKCNKNNFNKNSSFLSNVLWVFYGYFCVIFVKIFILRRRKATLCALADTGEIKTKTSHIKSQIKH